MLISNSPRWDPWMVNVALVRVLTYLYGMNQSLRTMTMQVYRRVDAPTNKVTFLGSVGPVFDASMILEDELELRRRVSLDKMDKYFYENISGLFRYNGRSYIHSKWIYLYVREVSLLLERKL
jgi:hypothetical protein